MSENTPKGPFHLAEIDGVVRIFDKKNNDVMSIEGGPERLVECANAFGNIWFPETHIKESEAYCQRLEQLRKDAWSRVKELEAQFADVDTVSLDGEGQEAQSSVRIPDGPVAAANAGGDDVDGGAARASTHNEVEVAGHDPNASTSPQFNFVWNYDMAAAPRGETVLQTRKGANGPVEVPVYKHVKLFALGSAGTVTISKWLPDELRWEMFSKDCPPIAWQPWPTAPAEVA